MPTIELEKRLWSEGNKYVIGIDEVGRGPLAGPVVAGALLITSEDQVVDGVRDSKKLSEKKRLELDSSIRSVSTAFGVGIVSNVEIDTLGITRAVNLAMKLALSELLSSIGVQADILLIDGKGVRDIEGYRCIKMDKGDLNHYSIAAASIIAKVARDNLMKEFSTSFPHYGFDRNMGYGTKEHIDAINLHGICDIHRKSFAPISKLVVNMR